MTRVRFATGILLVATSLRAGAAALDPELPPYEPGPQVAGEIVVAGNHATDEVMETWARRFQLLHPGVTVRIRHDTRLTTDAFAAAIAADDIDLVPSARELVPSEVERLTRKLGGPPLVVAVATGSYATKSGTHALAFYVNAANPLERISVAQIREIYAPGGKITKWGDLGLTGDWADQPIRVFSIPISDPNGNPLGIVNYLTGRVLGDKPGWRRSIYQVDSDGPELGRHMLTRIVREVADNRYAIGYSGFGFAAPGVKALAIAETDAGPWYKGTHGEVERRVYPFTRTIYLGVNRATGARLRPAVREFLHYVLSRDGQSAFTEGIEKYLPLTAGAAAAERAKLR